MAGTRTHHTHMAWVLNPSPPDNLAKQQVCQLMCTVCGSDGIVGGPLLLAEWGGVAYHCCPAFNLISSPLTSLLTLFHTSTLVVAADQPDGQFHSCARWYWGRWLVKADGGWQCCGCSNCAHTNIEEKEEEMVVTWLCMAIEGYGSWWPGGCPPSFMQGPPHLFVMDPPSFMSTCFCSYKGLPLFICTHPCLFICTCPCLFVSACPCSFVCICPFSCRTLVCTLLAMLPVQSLLLASQYSFVLTFLFPTSVVG